MSISASADNFDEQENFNHGFIPNCESQNRHSNVTDL